MLSNHFVLPEFLVCYARKDVQVTNLGCLTAVKETRMGSALGQGAPAGQPRGSVCSVTVPGRDRYDSDPWNTFRLSPIKLFVQVQGYRKNGQAEQYNKYNFLILCCRITYIFFFFQ